MLFFRGEQAEERTELDVEASGTLWGPVMGGGLSPVDPDLPVLLNAGAPRPPHTLVIDRAQLRHMVAVLDEHQAAAEPAGLFGSIVGQAWHLRWASRHLAAVAGGAPLTGTYPRWTLAHPFKNLSHLGWWFHVDHMPEAYMVPDPVAMSMLPSLRWAGGFAVAVSTPPRLVLLSTRDNHLTLRAFAFDGADRACLPVIIDEVN